MLPSASASASGPSSCSASRRRFSARSPAVVGAPSPSCPERPPSSKLGLGLEGAGGGVHVVVVAGRGPLSGPVAVGAAARTVAVAAVVASGVGPGAAVVGAVTRRPRGGGSRRRGEAGEGVAVGGVLAAVRESGGNLRVLPIHT